MGLLSLSEGPDFSYAVQWSGVIKASPFSGEGHRKVTARLRRKHPVWEGRNGPSG